VVSDPAGWFVGTGSPQRLAESFLDGGQFVFVALRNDGTVVSASRGVRALLGWEPRQVTGRNILELVHPEDVDRAVLHMAAPEAGQGARNVARFRVMRADGAWQEMEIWGAPVSDGSEDLVGFYGRSAEHQAAVEDILAMLLQGLSRADLLSRVCDVVPLGAGSQLAVSWEDHEGYHQVSTGLAPELGGGDGRSGTPWAASRAEPGAAVDGDLEDLPEDLSRLARRAGVSLFRIEPVAWSSRYVPALVTVWTVGGGVTPHLHSYGLAVARNLVELVLRWTEQMADMSNAARSDALTGLLNRRAFFAALDSHHGGGAVLYCDLDRFKPVNDTYGDRVGDRLLQLAAGRISSCVRESDLVGRLGGDEFAVLCSGATHDQAIQVAHRIGQSFAEPFAVLGSDVAIGISVGVASSEVRVGAELLGKADRALLEAKAAGRGTVREA
jgi:diguanylate cyclase (GGDEF)-like protein/PAS domain S-box-containing protein